MLTTIYYFFKHLEHPSSHFIEKLTALGIRSAFNPSLPVSELQGRKDLLILTDNSIDYNTFSSSGIPVIYVESPEHPAPMNARYLLLDYEEVDISYLIKVHSRLIGVPAVIASDDRMILRELCADDYSAFADYYNKYREFFEEMNFNIAEEDDDRASENVHKKAGYNIADANGEYAGREYFEAYCKSAYDFYDYGLYLITTVDGIVPDDIVSNSTTPGHITPGDVASNITTPNGTSHGNVTSVGIAGLMPDSADNAVQIGYLIDKSHRRQGFAYRACKHLIKYAEELGFEVILAHTASDNLPSRMLLKSLGFTPDTSVPDPKTIQYALRL
ncbi:MAG: GNAT family N-acetyltransferase [Lachnospiraceae bacterium]|nr:GNAT family N-acetyltransferase [Lachnospiraceae bacterium]